MLNAGRLRITFFGAFAVTLLVQFYTAFNHQLFGDEAFYWLEGQHLDWSYAELPGWTQWLAALTDWLLPRTPGFLRLPSLLAAISLPVLAMAMARTLQANQIQVYTTGLLTLSLPMLTLTHTLALPDVWLVFFGMLSVWQLLLAVHRNGQRHYLMLGLLLALGINVHVRFWLLVMIAGLATLWLYRHQRDVVMSLLSKTLPVMLLGFVPVLMFNLKHQFPLFMFQFQDRHPWQFQPDHGWFFLSEALVATPVVFALCTIVVLRHFNAVNPAIKLVVQLAVWHWLFYALVGFYSDNLRFSLHWTLFSYVLLLIIAGSHYRVNWLLKAAIVSGVLCAWIMPLAILNWTREHQNNRPFQDEFTANIRGWETLADKTGQLIRKWQPDQLVADHFMTLSTLRYHSTAAVHWTVLPHPLNRKHGREVQLKLMGYSADNDTHTKSLVVIEHSALTTSQQIPFYQDACLQLGGLKWVDSLNIDNGLKTYHFFTNQTTGCDLPTISYVDMEDGLLSGWAVIDKDQVPQIALVSNGQVWQADSTVGPLGSNAIFSALSNETHQLLRFSFSSADAIAHPGQLRFTYTDRITYGSTLYPP
ncbi:ArnT family glycosyltransferase [Marinicella sediminis]|uniref:ArnT family glycosyltransferase n=1 Tax=Marinicella sediminis TaxID=1792834 RepID=A0ABV7J9P9_9GAMM|nr:glycosyltransferase family 39 protein [Marinicella sediminis]